VLPLEDLCMGLGAVWARMKMRRRRNREVLARSGLTGDGRGARVRVGSGSAARAGEENEGCDASGDGDVTRAARRSARMTWLGRWRRRQEEKLGLTVESMREEERWGVGDAVTAGGDGGGGGDGPGLVLGERTFNGRLGSGAETGRNNWSLEELRSIELRRVKEGRDSGGVGI
jgi:hypothetical protein